MRYPEPKSRSAELLRLALAQMGRHDAAFNPVTFTVWYEVVAGINPRLNAAVDAMLADKLPLDDAAIASLHREHVAPPDEATIERIGGQMQQLMTSVAQSATHAGDSAGSFGAHLNGITQALAARDPALLAPQIGALIDATTVMKESVDTLQQRVAESRQEIGRLRNDLERARGEALIDALTGVLNRKGFDQKMQAMLRMPTAPGRCHCLVLIDIDHFKQVNDAHGHVTGDRVIQGVGEVLRALPEAAFGVARYGGEEFAVLLPETTVERSAQIADMLRLRIKSMKLRDRRTQDVLLTVTVSCGVAALRSGEDGAALVARADAALYSSKKQGRDRVTVS